MFTPCGFPVAGSPRNPLSRTAPAFLRAAAASVATASPGLLASDDEWARGDDLLLEHPATSAPARHSASPAFRRRECDRRRTQEQPSPDGHTHCLYPI